MKKKLFLIMASVMLMMAGCQKDNNANNGNENGGNNPGDEPQTELLAPEILSKEIVRLPTGFNTLFVKLRNPNNVYLDYGFNADFIRDGEYLGSLEWSGSIQPNEVVVGWANGVSWGNHEIPDNIDEIVINDLFYSESYYHPVKLNLIKEELSGDGVLSLVYNAKEPFSIASVYVVFYHDDQITCHDERIFLPGEELKCEMVATANFNRYEIYTNAYSDPVK